MATIKDKLPALESRFALKYPNENLTLHASLLRPPPTFVWMPGASNVMSNDMNRSFNIGFSKVSTVLGMEKGDDKNRSSLFEILLRNELGIHSIGGRSIGSAAAIRALIKIKGDRINNLVLISPPFSPTYDSRYCSSLRQIPTNVNILFVLGDNDDHGALVNGKSLDNSYRFIDGALRNHKIWKIMMRHSSHGNNVPIEHGGDAAKVAMLEVVGQVVAGWLCDDSKSGVNREGCVWYDINAQKAHWSGWQSEFKLARAIEWKI